MHSIGLDIVDTERIAKNLNRFGERFALRVLGPSECELFAKRKNQPEFLAGRFACKEAVVKALGEFLQNRPPWRAIEILNDVSGQPELHLPAEISKQLAGHTCMISISHEKKFAAAVAVIVEEK